MLFVAVLKYSFYLKRKIRRNSEENSPRNHYIIIVGIDTETDTWIKSLHIFSFSLSSNTKNLVNILHYLATVRGDELIYTWNIFWCAVAKQLKNSGEQPNRFPKSMIFSAECHVFNVQITATDERDAYKCTRKHNTNTCTSDIFHRVYKRLTVVKRNRNQNFGNTITYDGIIMRKTEYNTNTLPTCLTIYYMISFPHVFQAQEKCKRACNPFGT